MVVVSKICECCEKPYTREVGVNYGRAKYCSKECHNKIKRFLMYKTTFKEVVQMIEDQNNQCAICLKEFDSEDRHAINIDHCHKTGRVRGILCQTCNRGLGQFKDNVDILNSAIKYLEK